MSVEEIVQKRIKLFPGEVILQQEPCITVGMARVTGENQLVLTNFRLITLIVPPMKAASRIEWQFNLPEMQAGAAPGASFHYSFPPWMYYLVGGVFLLAALLLTTLLGLPSDYAGLVIFFIWTVAIGMSFMMILTAVTQGKKENRIRTQDILHVSGPLRNARIGGLRNAQQWAAAIQYAQNVLRYPPPPPPPPAR
jgi:hypothetical protein